MVRWKKNEKMFDHVGVGMRLFSEKLDDGEEKVIADCGIHISKNISKDFAVPYNSFISFIYAEIRHTSQSLN